MSNIQVILAILGALLVWTGTVAGVVLWLMKEFKETRHTLRAGMDQRFAILDEKIDDKSSNLDTRVRHIELHIAKKNGVIV